MSDRKPTRFELRLPAELGDEIDAWRRGQPDLPPRAEAARRLIEAGLRAEAGASSKITSRTLEPTGGAGRAARKKAAPR
jgi:hypothetical protein